jgi:hypothetical protein
MTILPFIIRLPAAVALPAPPPLSMVCAMPAEYSSSENDGARGEVHKKMMNDE